MATNLYRRDEEIVDAMGNPVSGVQIALATQPANTSSFPPTPTVKLFGDGSGNPLPTPYPTTDAYGHCSYYAPPGLYTVVFYSTQIATPSQTLVLIDQVLQGPAQLPTQFKADSSTAGTITPLPDGVETQFNLSAVPNPAQSLVFSINGLYVSAYTLLPGLLTVVLPTAPHAGALLMATYQT
jgi:hypothetical protein